MMTPIPLLVLAFCCFPPDYPRTVPQGSAIYVRSGSGFGELLGAALQAKHIPLRIVSSREEADYTLAWGVVPSAESVETAALGPVVFPTTNGSARLMSKSGDVVWRYVFSKRVVNRGGQSVADNIAGHIREVVVKARKRRPTV